MKRRHLAVPLLAGLVAAAGCGSSNNGSSSSGTPAANAPANAKKGGTLTILSSGDVDYIDPGQDYYQLGYQIEWAVNRGLYSYGPADTKPRPDLATAAPEISKDGKTVTIHIRKGIKYAPPVNRVVTSKDIKYAVERAFSGHVPNAYVFTYLSSIQGAPTKPDPKGVPSIPGIQTPDDSTIVFKLTKPASADVVGTLSLPVSVPVPEEYAKPFDAKNPSTYDQHVAFVGPYMVEHDASGKLTGRKPGKSITLVRNPNWDKAKDGDYRAAYVDKIVMDEGNNDPNVASRRILTGNGLVTGDFTLPPNILKQALSREKDQVNVTQTAAYRSIALNTTVKPFDNINVRKAVFAVYDRQALVLSRGGTAQGTPAWSFLPPGFPGYEQSGGATPPAEFDFAKNFNGDPTLAASYMKKAGYPSGKYTGSDRPLLIGVAGGTGTKAAEITQAQLAKLGIKVKFRLVTPDAYLTKFCGSPKARVGICPSTAWGKDFNDGSTMLKPTFYGPAIAPANNVNYSELNDPAVNAAIEKAAALPPGAERDQAWADVNKLVVGTAAQIPYQWDKTVNAASKDVAAVLNVNNTSYDLNFTSLR